MGYKLIAQLILIVASLVIIFSFIQPSFFEIRKIQDEVFQYKDTVAKATQLNSVLQQLVAARDSVPQESIKILEHFIPSTIDSLQVMKDIESIFTINLVPIISLVAGEEVKPTTDVNFEGDIVNNPNAPITTYQDFSVNFEATYVQMKDLLLFLEANAALLEVVELNFDTLADTVVEEEVSTKNNTHNFTLRLRAYGLAASQN